jgi:hypothetical protein
MSLKMVTMVLLLPEIELNMRWGVERRKTTEGFGACNEKTNYPYFSSSETPLDTGVPDRRQGG